MNTRYTAFGILFQFLIPLLIITTLYFKIYKFLLVKEIIIPFIIFIIFVLTGEQHQEQVKAEEDQHDSLHQGCVFLLEVSLSEDGDVSISLFPVGFLSLCSLSSPTSVITKTKMK